jgi:hypothetical protein
MLARTHTFYLFQERRPELPACELLASEGAKRLFEDVEPGNAGKKFAVCF